MCRPPSNTDSTTVAAVAARSMNATVSRESHPTEREFVGGRQVTADILEMDAYARLFCTIAPNSDCPVKRAFLFRAVEFLGFPDGLIRTVWVLHADSTSLWQRPLAAKRSLNERGRIVVPFVGGASSSAIWTLCSALCMGFRGTPRSASSALA